MSFFGMNSLKLSQVEGIIASTISTILTDAAGTMVPTAWAKQSYPQFHKPYAVLQYTQAPMKLGHDTKTYDSTGDATVVGNREMVIGVSVFGENAYSLLADLQNANEFDAVRALFLTANTVFVMASQIRDLSQIEGANYQTRGQMDITFRVLSLAVDNSNGYIDSVKIDNAIDSSTSTVTG